MLDEVPGGATSGAIDAFSSSILLVAPAPPAPIAPDASAARLARRLRMMQKAVIPAAMSATTTMARMMAMIAPTLMPLDFVLEVGVVEAPDEVPFEEAEEEPDKPVAALPEAVPVGVSPDEVGEDPTAAAVAVYPLNVWPL
jgi:hypothetical protein